MKLAMMLKSFLLSLLLVASLPSDVEASPLGSSTRIIGGDQATPGDYPYFGKSVLPLVHLLSATACNSQLATRNSQNANSI